MPPVDQVKRNELGFEGMPSYDSQHLSMSFDSAKWQSMNQGIDWRRESLQVQGYPTTTKDGSWASTPNPKVGSRWTQVISKKKIREQSALLCKSSPLGFLRSVTELWRGPIGKLYTVCRVNSSKCCLTLGQSNGGLIDCFLCT